LIVIIVSPWRRGWGWIESRIVRVHVIINLAWMWRLRRGRMLLVRLLLLRLLLLEVLLMGILLETWMIWFWRTLRLIVIVIVVVLSKWIAKHGEESSPSIRLWRRWRWMEFLSWNFSWHWFMQ